MKRNSSASRRVGVLSFGLVSERCISGEVHALHGRSTPGSAALAGRSALAGRIEGWLADLDKGRMAHDPPGDSKLKSHSLKGFRGQLMEYPTYQTC